MRLILNVHLSRLLSFSGQGDSLIDSWYFADDFRLLQGVLLWLAKAGRLDESYCWRKIFRWIKNLHNPLKILSILCGSMLWLNPSDNSVFHETLFTHFMKLVLIHHLRTTDKQAIGNCSAKQASHPEDQLAQRTMASELFKPKSPWTGQDVVWAS